MWSCWNRCCLQAYQHDVSRFETSFFPPCFTIWNSHLPPCFHEKKEKHHISVVHYQKAIISQLSNIIISQLSIIWKQSYFSYQSSKNNIISIHYPIFPQKEKSGWWFGTLLLFSIQLGIITIPIDELILFKELGLNPTTNQIHRLSIDYVYINHRLTI